jgi:putative endonuclease
MAPIKPHPTEALAAKYLAQNGLALLEQNYHSRFGEIDLIMRDQHTLVFIEVRQRSSNRFGGALVSVSNRKSFLPLNIISPHTLTTVRVVLTLSL